MRRLLVTLVGVLATTSAGWAADTPAAADAPAAASLSERWSATLNSEVRYFSWRSDVGFPNIPATADRGRGAQLYIPYGLQLTGRPTDDLKIDIVGRGGWVRARQSTADKSGEVATTTDTQVSATAAYLGISGIQPFVSINFNIPTGKSVLFGSAANARMDPDLVDIATFGEGLNVGPTAGLSAALARNVIATVSGGYTWRGSYDREGPQVTPPLVQGTTQIDPGDVLTGTVSIGYQVDRLLGQITGSISTETDTKVAGQRMFRPGVRFLLTGTWLYTWPETWGVTTVTAAVAHAKKNKVLFLDQTTLAPIIYDSEPFNTNSNLYRVGIEHLFAIGRFSAGPVGSFLYRDRNGYNSATLQFVPAKERWSAGLLARYAASERVTFNARLEHVWTHAHDNSGDIKTSLLLIPNSGIPIGGVSPVSSTGWQCTFGANVQL
jgi:hypothetical protein